MQWSSNPNLWGRQQQGADRVDFSGQKGVYLLHDGHRTIYVGRTTEQTLGRRLYQHTRNRLEGRWNRWSWFGLLGVTDDGQLQEPAEISLEMDKVVTALEALLIESLEPAQNRSRGDDFRAVEYLQAEDPQLEQEKMKEIMERMQDELFS